MFLSSGSLQVTLENPAWTTGWVRTPAFSLHLPGGTGGRETGTRERGELGPFLHLWVRSLAEDVNPSAQGRAALVRGGLGLRSDFWALNPRFPWEIPKWSILPFTNIYSPPFLSFSSRSGKRRIYASLSICSRFSKIRNRWRPDGSLKDICFPFSRLLFSTKASKWSQRLENPPSCAALILSSFTAPSPSHRKNIPKYLICLGSLFHLVNLYICPLKARHPRPSRATAQSPAVPQRWPGSKDNPQKKRGAPPGLFHVSQAFACIYLYT